MKRINITSKLQPRVRHVGPTEAPVDPAFVAKALGAQPVARVPPGLATPAFAGLRQEIAKRLTSTGGRPALEGTARRQKIPLSDADWRRLLELAENLAAEGMRPTPGQVASALLHSSLINLHFAASMVRSREALLDDDWPQTEGPTGENLFELVAQIRPFSVPETMEPIAKDLADRTIASWVDDLEKVAS